MCSPAGALKHTPAGARALMSSELWDGLTRRGVVQAKWIGPKTRAAVVLLADALYLTVAFQLVRALTCVDGPCAQATQGRT